MDIAPEHWTEVYLDGKWVKKARATIVCKVPVIVVEYLRERSFKVSAEEEGMTRWRTLVGEGGRIFEPVQKEDGRDGDQILALKISEAR